MLKQDWDLMNIPPAGDPDVPEFAFLCYESARIEKERLKKPSGFLYNYGLYRGQINKQQQVGRKGYSARQNPTTAPINLYFANVERTVSNITSRNPVGEVIDLDGISKANEEAQGFSDEGVLNMFIKKWWKDTDQLPKTRGTARNMEVYGFTSEKPFWDKLKQWPDIQINDPYGVFPAPGYYENLDLDAPYVCYASVDFISTVANRYKAEESIIAEDEAYSLMGGERENYKADHGDGQTKTIGNYAEPMSVRGGTGSQGGAEKKLRRCLVIEVWIRDNRTTQEVTTTPVVDEAGAPLLMEDGLTQQIQEITVTKPVYRDGVRKITITRSKDPGNKSGFVVLDDSANPNLNPALETEKAINTYPWGRLPIYYANSYRDGISIWGFSAAEQVGDLILKINQIFSKLVAYVINVMAPPLIIQQHCGITREMVMSSINQAGRMILMPSIPNARIEFMQIPNLPQTFFQVLNLIVQFFDRVYQIEDADRGVAPSGVIAASAIVALQERNQVLMKAKTSAIDFIAEQRSKWAIGLLQNFGFQEETVSVNDYPVKFRGVEYAGRNFNYMVESGSTSPRTSLQLQEMAYKLYEAKAIGQRGLLQALNWPGWKEEIERTAESQVAQALQILIDAGLPEEDAVKIQQFVMESSVQNTIPKEPKATKQPAAAPQPQAGG